MFKKKSGEFLADVCVGKYGKEDRIYIMDAQSQRVGLIDDQRLSTVPSAPEDLLEPRGPVRGPGSGR